MAFGGQIKWMALKWSLLIYNISDTTGLKNLKSRCQTSNDVLYLPVKVCYQIINLSLSF